MSDRYEAELEYLQEFVNDCLRELEYLIHVSDPCESFEARWTGDYQDCRHCAFKQDKH